MNEWWGYIHTNGSIQVKRVFDDRDYQLCLEDARESPFVSRIIPRFNAESRDDAIRIITVKL